MHQRGKPTLRGPNKGNNHRYCNCIPCRGQDELAGAESEVYTDAPERCKAISFSHSAPLDYCKSEHANLTRDAAKMQPLVLVCIIWALGLRRGQNSTRTFYEDAGGEHRCLLRLHLLGTRGKPSIHVFGVALRVTRPCCTSCAGNTY